MSDQPPSTGRSLFRGRVRIRPETPESSPFEQAIIARVREAAELELRDVMTPRVDVVYLEYPVTPEQVAEAVRESGHSAFPVAPGELDACDGVLLVNDLFRSSSRKKGIGGVTLPGQEDIERKIREPFVLPETMEIFEALEEMRQNHRTFAIVVDEHGGVAGVVSTRDLLEPLVGDLSDEYDEDEIDEIVLISPERWLVQGHVHVDTLNEVTGIDLPEGEYVTVAGYLLDSTETFPKVGTEVDYNDWRFKVHEVEKRRITEIVVSRIPAAEQNPGSAADE